MTTGHLLLVTSLSEVPQGKHTSLPAVSALGCVYVSELPTSGEESQIGGQEASFSWPLDFPSLSTVPQKEKSK